MAEEKAVFHNHQDSTHTCAKRLNSDGKSVQCEQAAQSPKQPPCPKCRSIRVYKDGWRQTKEDQTQRFLCRDCGRRFGEKEPAQKQLGRHIYSSIGSQSISQVCETEDSKNLAEITRQEPAPREGTVQAAAITGKIVEYVWWMKKQGYSETTILGRYKLLKILQKRGADVYDPESVKTTIASQVWSEGRKANAVDAYTSLLRMVGGKWEPPRYQSVRKIPFIPTDAEVDQLIAGCSSRMGTFLQLLKETGMRSGEAWRLAHSDVDTTTKTVRITPEKNSNPRIAHITPKLAAMLDASPKTYGNRVFSNPSQPLDHFRDMFSQQRKRTAFKLKNPRILRITFHTLRHFKGTMEYHRTKDILHVMQVLGHKNIKNTLLYVQLAEELFKDQQEYVSKVAKNEIDACALVEAGFEYVCDIDNVKIFKKRKY